MPVSKILINLQFKKRNGQYNQQQIGEYNCNPAGPQSPHRGASLQNSWSSVVSNNAAAMNHTGVDCDVNSVDYGQPPPGHTQHQQVKKLFLRQHSKKYP